jgi:branched-chain amino acid transport system permease protein
MAALIVDGIVLGSIIALGSVGLTLIWGITDLFNCAHGDQITAGAYLALLFGGMFARLGGPLAAPVGPFSFSWGILLSFIPAVILSIGLAIGIDRVVYRPMRKAGAHFITAFIASIGVAWALRGVIYIIWGADFHFYTQGLRSMIYITDTVRLRVDEIFIMIVAWASVAAVYLFMARSKTGKALRALADNPTLARVSGINIERLLMWAWGIAGLLVAISGVLYGIETQLRPEMGWIFLLPLFAAVILGGKGSITGALAGGLVMGVAQQVSTAFLVPTYKPAVAFIIMILVLIFRPKGIFGRRTA